MTDKQTTLMTLYKGWDVYQEQLVKAITPLAAEQLALRAAPQLRSVGMIAAHIVGARVRWFHRLMGEGSVDIHMLGIWDRPEAPVRSAAELDHVFEGTYGGEEYSLTRQWIIWHVIEHDLHHGGEISLTLGAHGLLGLDL